MCFSAEADLAAGLVVGVVAIDALRHVRRPAEQALAALPFLFAGHQLVEAVVWRGLEGEAAEAVWRPALWTYLVIAFGVLPVLVPVAVAAAEPPGTRRAMRPFSVLGAAVSVVLVHAIVRGPIEARIEGNHIDYRVDLWHGGLIVVLYVLATCGSMLASAHRHVRWYGAANLVVAGGLAWLSSTAFISLWCAWAAVTSVAIAVHLRAADPQLRTPPLAA